ncbi:MarR family transcriptional regulator [Puteibacter caeruleilacunae]|nr:MarR family transcriptional regulator [Puteibacter caeruleilacunae]
MSDSCKTYQECCLYFTANSLSRFINNMAEDAFRLTGLSPSYGHLMLLLINEPGLSQGELSQRMNVKASTMTRFIDKLIVMQYVKRVQEGRTTLIFPTEEGKKLKVLIDKALTQLYKNYCEVLGEEFAVRLTEDIHKANTILKK